MKKRTYKRKRKVVYQIRVGNEVLRRSDDTKVFFLSRKAAKERAAYVGGKVETKRIV